MQEHAGTLALLSLWNRTEYNFVGVDWLFIVNTPFPDCTMSCCGIGTYWLQVGPVEGNPVAASHYGLICTVHRPTVSAASHYGLICTMLRPTVSATSHYGLICTVHRPTVPATSHYGLICTMHRPTVSATALCTGLQILMSE